MARRFRSYRLSRRAEQDLEEIYSYTATRWLIEQADRYVAEIGAAIQGLVEGDKVGRGRPNAPAAYLFYLAGSHLIVYRATELILVARVLRQSMDVPRRLGP